VTLASSSFSERWRQSAAAERANYQLFLSELCDFLDVPRPDPSRAEDHLNTYVFEKPVIFHNLDGTTSQGRIDLYRRSHFVLEAKQGSNPPVLETNGETGDLFLTPPASGATYGATSPVYRAARQRRGTAVRGTHGWDEAMLNAYNQAERYAKALPAFEGWPPFLVTVDVGHSIELFADFSLTGKAYLPFPDARSYRILLGDLANPDIRERLRLVWTDPHALNPARHAAKVTREVAAKLAVLARTLEQKHSVREVAEFLTRCIFTSFAEDVKLLPEKSWYKLLSDHRDSGNVAVFPEMAKSLWDTMNAGGFSPILKAHVHKFNGGLFESTEALPLTGDQLALLIDAADSDWKDVEPAIFGTLLERALEAGERHQLGAHYTPRAYVERLVIPTIVEPLRADWADVIAAVSELVASGHTPDAIEILHDFHRRLLNTRVLDPACGSGNFLYVALEHMKRLEGEILESLATLGETQQALEHTGLTVNPHQLLGIDINPRATAVADLVLWIGYLQWHYRTRGDVTPPVPVISNFHNIECRDALMTYDAKVPALDEHGQQITEWDRVTFTRSAITGRKIPDPTARRPVFSCPNARKTVWPDADFIVGNPPFIGKGKLIKDLGEGYIKTLRDTYNGEVPNGSDFVMYWWKKAAERVATGQIRRSGLISTNSISQVFNSRVVGEVLSTVPATHLSFAIPDHPWVDDEDGAAIRISMTVLARGDGDGTLATIVDEKPSDVETGLVEVSLLLRTGLIHRNLTVGVNVTLAKPLKAAKRYSKYRFDSWE
jgi:SAM-dependent methyltransferase